MSIVESEKSMISVAQSLWKFGAALLLQEFMKFDFDIRTIVVNGKSISVYKKNKCKERFSF